MTDSQRGRVAARDRALHRASTATGWIAAGGVAATVLAAVVFAQSPADATTDTAPADAPALAGQLPDEDGGGPVADAPDTDPAVPAPAVPHRSQHSSAGSGGSGLRAPATPVLPVAPQGGHHASSGAS